MLHFNECRESIGGKRPAVAIPLMIISTEPTVEGCGDCGDFPGMSIKIEEKLTDSSEHKYFRCQ